MHYMRHSEKFPPKLAYYRYRYLSLFIFYFCFVGAQLAFTLTLYCGFDSSDSLLFSIFIFLLFLSFFLSFLLVRSLLFVLFPDCGGGCYPSLLSHCTHAQAVCSLILIPLHPHAKLCIAFYFRHLSCIHTPIFSVSSAPG
ncbi:hypothetical protein DFH27DRAFT_369807 [Peziza echinospora]|nr:hypothetical protein DFH27DRAFT_369807 [Peziza echinospora]